MKAPHTWTTDQSAVDGFVLASKTERLFAACRFLFINAKDLAWGDPNLGFYLPVIRNDCVFRDALEIAEASTEMSFYRLFGRVLPYIEPILAGVVGKMESENPPTEQDKVRSFLNGLLEHVPLGKEFDAKMVSALPTLSDGLVLASTWLATKLAKGAFEYRDRILASAGLSAEEYSEMAVAMQGLRPDFTSVVRVTIPKDGSFPELCIAGVHGLPASEPLFGAGVVELLRAKPALVQAKQGQDCALPLFIAAHINSHVFTGQQAFPCAKYGERDTADYDVVVPALELGFESKLLQASFTQVENRLDNLVRKLGEQLPHYFEAGCKEVVVVTNLTESLAQTALRRAREANLSLREKQISVVSDIEELIGVLEDVEKRLGDRWGESIAKRVRTTRECEPAKEVPNHKLLATT